MIYLLCYNLDVDECLESSSCENGDCKNFPGTYQCRCDKGYKSGNNNSCVGR